MKTILTLTLALAIAAGPALAAPAEVTIQTRPDRVGDRYSYTVEYHNRDADGVKTDELQTFTVEILEVDADGLRIATIRQGGAPTGSDPGGVDALWDRSWFGIRVVARATRQGTPIQVLNTAEAEPLITAKIRKALAMPDSAVFNSVAVRFESEQPAVIASRWAAGDLAKIGVLQHRGSIKLGTQVDPVIDTSAGVKLRKTTEIRDYDAATCQVRVIHLLDFFNPAGKHHTLRSEAIVSTRDGWTIRYDGLETLVNGSTKATKIVRVGPSPGCA